MNAERQTWRVAGHEWFDAPAPARWSCCCSTWLRPFATCTGRSTCCTSWKPNSPPPCSSRRPNRPAWFLPPSGSPNRFKRMMTKMTQNDLVLRDITGKHPVELIYAWFAFFYTPLLVVLVAGNRIAEEIGSGSVRYVIFRTSRASWSLGKFVGQTLMIGLALMLSGASAYAVAKFRLAGSARPTSSQHGAVVAARPGSIPSPISGWPCGPLALTRSPSKATVMGILAITLCFALSILIRHFTLDTGWRRLPAASRPTATRRAQDAALAQRRRTAGRWPGHPRHARLLLPAHRLCLFPQPRRVNP